MAIQIIQTDNHSYCSNLTSLSWENFTNCLMLLKEALKDETHFILPKTQQSRTQGTISICNENFIIPDEKYLLRIKLKKLLCSSNKVLPFIAAYHYIPTLKLIKKNTYNHQRLLGYQDLLSCYKSQLLKIWLRTECYQLIKSKQTYFCNSNNITILNKIVAKCCSNTKKIRYNFSKDVIVLDYMEKTIPLFEHPYKNQVYTIADIVHRCCRLNNQLNDPTQVKGLLCVDLNGWNQDDMFPFLTMFPSFQFLLYGL